jgi:hypothetical protein
MSLFSDAICLGVESPRLRQSARNRNYLESAHRQCASSTSASSQDIPIKLTVLHRQSGSNKARKTAMNSSLAVLVRLGFLLGYLFRKNYIANF